LAAMFQHVNGYDISSAHIDIARARAKELQLSNVSFVECSSDFLEILKPCDVFYSRIVFQHNPPPIIHELVKHALRSVRPGGVAVFQVPTYIKGYKFNIEEWIAAKHVLDMQMHCLPQADIFELAGDEACDVLEVREDDSTGAPERFISNTFVIRKREKVRTDRLLWQLGGVLMRARSGKK